jgi:predicted ATPase
VAPLLPSRHTVFAESAAGQTSFVGRDQERALLRLLLAKAIRGERPVLMLSGAPGVGRMRLANEVRAEASRNGFVTLGGSCFEREAAAPLDRFVQMIDDLHWADESTLSLLVHLVRGVSLASLIIIGSYRDIDWKPAGPIATLLGDLVRLRALESLKLAGLPLDAVGEMLEALSGRTAPESLAAVVYSGTEDNPLLRRGTLSASA